MVNPRKLKHGFGGLVLGSPICHTFPSRCWSLSLLHKLGISQAANRELAVGQAALPYEIRIYLDNQYNSIPQLNSPYNIVPLESLEP